MSNDFDISSFDFSETFVASLCGTCGAGAGGCFGLDTACLSASLAAFLDAFSASSFVKQKRISVYFSLTMQYFKLF